MNDGSRELLLALGWLLCREHIINRFMINCTSPLDEDTAALHQVRTLQINYVRAICIDRLVLADELLNR